MKKVTFLLAVIAMVTVAGCDNSSMQTNPAPTNSVAITTNMPSLNTNSPAGTNQ